MKKKTNLPKSRHPLPKPRLRARHLSSTGKSAYAPAPAGVPAFSSGPTAFAPGAGGMDSAPLMGPGGGPAGMG